MTFVEYNLCWIILISLLIPYLILKNSSASIAMCFDEEKFSEEQIRISKLEID